MSAACRHPRKTARRFGWWWTLSTVLAVAASQRQMAPCRAADGMTTSVPSGEIAAAFVFHPGPDEAAVDELLRRDIPDLETLFVSNVISGQAGRDAISVVNVEPLQVGRDVEENDVRLIPCLITRTERAPSGEKAASRICRHTQPRHAELGDRPPAARGFAAPLWIVAPPRRARANHPCRRMIRFLLGYRARAQPQLFKGVVRRRFATPHHTQENSSRMR